MAGKAAKTEAPKTQPLELSIERNFAAPRDLVWQAWTDIETVCTGTFAARGAKTHMHFHQAGFGTASSRDGHRGGWTSSFGVRDALLATQK